MERPLSSLVLPGAHGTFSAPTTDNWIRLIGPTLGALLATILYGMVYNRG